MGAAFLPSHNNGIFLPRRSADSTPARIAFATSGMSVQQRRHQHQQRQLENKYEFVLSSSNNPSQGDDEDRQEEAYSLQGYSSPASSDDDSKKKESSSGGGGSSTGSRVRAKFDNLFSGMPSVGEILGSSTGSSKRKKGSGSGGDLTPAPPSSGSDKKKVQSDDAIKVQDDTWFRDEKERIVNTYEDIWKGMLAQLDEQRIEDPESVPENAEAMIKSVLKEEMDTEIESTREQRAQERLKDYERQLRADTDSQDVSGRVPDESVQKLMDESEKEYQQREASRALVDEFLRYEEEAFRKASKAPSSIQMPESGADLDQWALERLQDMAEKRQDGEGKEAILDILEESVNDLRRRMEKQAKKGSIEPETMKEWQMYRAIVTRQDLDDSKREKSGDDSKDLAAREQLIMAQLESWKNYIQKEDGNREKSGLARGPRLPFEWQESDLGKSKVSKVDKRTRAQVRKDINRMSIEALESLMQTADAARREKLRDEVEYLKSELESRDYLDIEEEIEVEKDTSPVDFTGVFQTNTDDDALPSRPEMAEYDSQFASSPPQSPTTDFFSDREPVESTSTSPPPNTPFFSDEDGDRTAKPPPPNTPFFSEEGVEETGGDSVAAEDSKLGSMEDQKLKAMYRRAGIRSEEEQARIKKEWEDFQIVEREKRRQSGLSSEGESGDELDSAKLKYELSDVLRDDGDIDAEKVLASIGPRPTRSKKQKSADVDAPGDPQKNNGTSTFDASDDLEIQDPSMKSSIDDEDVRESLYRSVAAVGGGRYKDDPEAKAKGQASFEEFLEKEDEMRQSLDELDESKLNVDSEDFDDVKYAEEVISSLGPRPKPKRARIINEGEFSDQGGVLSSEDDDDEEDDDATEESEGEVSVWDSMPDWLRKEREQDGTRDSGSTKGSFLGSDIDEIFDDDQYDKNMRQLHEYEQRRAGRQRQMGIDISDVLGPRAYDTDDYADYKYDDESFRGRQVGDEWASASFYSRKKDLLQYTELDLRELNSLMDHKDSPYSTGVSQYLPRINKPFKEFGAIFRLEGVLVDITGLQLKAWTKVAEQFEFKSPDIEQVRRASVIRPEVAVKDAFFWSDDFIECRKVAAAHKEAFREVFDAFMNEKGIEPPPADDTVGYSIAGSFLGDEVIKEEDTVPKPSASSTEIVGSSSKAWEEVARAYEKPIPSEAELFHAASLSATTAIRAAFLWSEDPEEVEEIAESYKHYMKTGMLPETTRSGRDSSFSSKQQSASQPESNGASRGPLDQNAVMEIQYYAWKKLAEEFQFDPPDPEQAMAAFVINNPQIAIRDGFGWTEDPKVVGDAAKAFQANVVELLKQRSNGPISIPDSWKPQESSSNQSPTASASDSAAEELLEKETKAWTSTATSFGFSLPTADIMLLALKETEPQEVITRLLRWTDNVDRADEIALTYQKYAKQYGLERDISSRARTPSPNNQAISQDEIFRAALDSWVAVSKKFGLPEPDIEQVQFALSVGPEEAIATGFDWTDDASKIQELVDAYRAEIGIRRQQWSSRASFAAAAAADRSCDDVPSYTVTPYAADWVKSLMDVEMGCCIVSYLERDQVDVLLDLAGLSGLFGRNCRVSATDGYGLDNQQLLGAALRLERRPDHCVVFDTSPYASIAAHEVEMQSVNIIGVYPRYELLASDSTTDSFSELTAMNIRRLFAERVYDQPLLETQAAQPKVQRKPKTLFWDEDF